MKRLIIIFAVILCAATAFAQKFSYRFNHTPLADALVQIAEQHPDIHINFIYNELDKYPITATVHTNDAYDMLRQLIGLNPVSVISSGGRYYIEALQHGKFCYRGRVLDEEHQPAPGTTIMILAPKDSTVITYGIADNAGRFIIPCDSRSVIAKFSCVGYKTTYRRLNDFNVSDIIMPIDAVALQQVKVEGQMATAYSDRTVYLPSQRQKNASQNAIDLLRQMAIPQIQINPIDNSIKDNGGGEVSIFFNNMPASQEDIEGLRTADVRRVEYLEFPTDPRFRGAQHVINIIIQEYEYGGYTKITANENFLVGLSSRTNIFTKFAYKKMTYDLYVAANNWDNHHAGYDVEGQYSLTDNQGKDYTLNRRETADNVHFRQNQYPVSFRASYNTDKVQIQNTIGYSHSAYPVQEQSGSLVYSPSKGDDYTFNRNNPSRSNSFSYNGSFVFALPKDFSVNVTPQFLYSHNINSLTYTTSSTEPIIRNARENAYYYRVNAYLNKRIANKHTLMLGINHGNTINRLQYTGNVLYSDRFNNAFVSGQLCYQAQIQKVNLYADAGVLWEQSNINGIKNYDTYPYSHINIRYTPNNKNAFSAYFQYANNTPGIDAKASDLLRDNEYMYITGNPLLDNSRHITLNLAYTWLPSNIFGMSAFGNYFTLINRQMTAYEAYDNGQALLRTYLNNGNYTQSEIGLSAILKLFDNSLQLYVSPKQCFNRSTGIFNKSYNPFQITAQVTYYLKQWFFQAYYQSPQKMMFSDSPTIYKSRDFYAIAAGWGNSKWNIQFTAYNIFNRHWDSADRYIQSPLYLEHRTVFGTNSHARLNLSVTYTIGYGKKVQRGNEVGEQSGASSAILK